MLRRWRCCSVLAFHCECSCGRGLTRRCRRRGACRGDRRRRRSLLRRCCGRRSGRRRRGACRGDRRRRSSLLRRCCGRRSGRRRRRGCDRRNDWPLPLRSACDKMIPIRPSVRGVVLLPAFDAAARRRRRRADRRCRRADRRRRRSRIRICIHHRRRSCWVSLRRRLRPVPLSRP